MQRQEVKSSNIKSMGYDSLNKILEIEFLNRTLYQYKNVPQEVYEKLMAAKSHGAFLTHFIKGYYLYKRVN